MPTRCCWRPGRSPPIASCARSKPARSGGPSPLAMLGKYYSVFLLVSFAFAAICHPQRRVYWTSWAPWVSIAAGLSALVPHLHWLLMSGAPPFAYALARHTGKAFAPSVIEAALFILGLAMVLALPAATWALMANDRLKQFPQDFWAMNSGLLLLFLVGVGTIVFPVITSVVCGTDMPPIWGLQGLFLFVILMVCGASYPIPRFYSVNLAVLVIGIAVVAVVVAAPVHALYRNDHPLHEGRNFYSQAAQELTRRWHEQSGAPLAAVGGDEGLAFGAAFYSPDHPVYEERLVLPHSEALPPHVAFRRGWAALCYDEDASCIASMEPIAARAPRLVRSAFVLQSSLFGQPGASQHFTALVVPPYDEEKIAPPPLPPVPRIAQVDSEPAPVLVRHDEPTCCAPRTDSADGESEFALRPALAAEEKEIKHARHAAPPPAAAPPANWPDRAATSASRDGFARWPIPVPRCTPHGSHVGCSPAERANALAASRGYGARPAYFCDNSGPTASLGSAPMAEPVSVRLKRGLCAMAADFDAGIRASQEKLGTAVGAARESADRRMQLWRRDSTPASPRRRI